MKSSNGDKLTEENKSATKISPKPNVASTQQDTDAEKTRMAVKPVEQDAPKTRTATRNSNRKIDKEHLVSNTTSPELDDKTRIASERQNTNPEATQFRPASSRTKKTKRQISNPALKEENNVVTPSDTPSEHNVLKKRFILEKILGTGGMGIVYKAKDLVKVEAGDKDPYLAVKVLGDEFKEHPEAFIALQRESRKTQKIAHPNIVNVHDFDRDGNTVFMTMEYLEGKPLDKLLRQYKSTGLPTDEASNILKNICRALIYAHKQDIIHSDFKPGNIFVTDKGATKVFDFGIARAVAKAEHYKDNPEDRTIFDAGDLGALTPAYASSEMLDGKEPDIRDDIYALGCVAYELFTGSHPFNKVPADEAKKQQLKPKRINHISRRQWKTIEKALAFNREDRVPTVKEFVRLFTNNGATYKLPLAIVSSVMLLFFVYTQYFVEVPQMASETEIRFKLRLENYRNSIDELLISSEFSNSWEDNLWKQTQGVKKLLSSSERWLASTKNVKFKAFIETNSAWYITSEGIIYSTYLEKIRLARKDGDLNLAQKLIDNAYRYTSVTDLLDVEKSLLASAITEANLLAEKKRKEKLIQSSIKSKKKETPKVVTTTKQEVKTKAQTPKQLKDEQFKIAFANVQAQLQCQSNKLNMRNLDTAIQKARSIDSNRYLKREKQLIAALVGCINHIGKPFPKRAMEFKKYALRLFNKNKAIAAIVITLKDPCSKSLAGLGARGKRATCKDSLGNLGTGPVLVVIPGAKGISTFALAKYELSVSEYNLFCRVSKSCSEDKTTSDNLPVANISLQQAENYLKWLNSKSKQIYRLPTRKEWLYAAKAKGVSLDPNRNCQVNTRGISKGDKFDRVTVGLQNSWGLVNYVGNAREWVYEKGRMLNAVGGSFNIPLENCNLSTQIKHSGKADAYTSLRILRELK